MIYYRAKLRPTGNFTAWRPLSGLDETHIVSALKQAYTAAHTDIQNRGEDGYAYALGDPDCKTCNMKGAPEHFGHDCCRNARANREHPDMNISHSVASGGTEYHCTCSGCF